VVRFVVAGRDDDAQPLAPDREYAVVYDGDCNVCTRLARLLRAWDRDLRLDVVPSTAPGVRARFPAITDAYFARALQLVGRDGTRREGVAAIEQVLRVLPKGPLVAWIFRIPGVRPIAERFYAWFARNRYRLGCGEHCRHRG
jgi:predicted DCC family thiol-disulfide oxidoreductase YuxK